MDESRKQEVARKYIEEKVLNKDLLALKNDITRSLEDLKEITSIKSPEAPSNQSEDFLGIDKFINIIFNKKGKQRGKLSYELRKHTTIIYYMISEEGKKNLDLLFEELEKTKSEEEALVNLGLEFSSLQQEILSGATEVKEKKENIENIDRLSTEEQYVYKQANLYGVTDQNQIAYILATVKGESNFKNIKEVSGETENYGKEGYYGRGFVQLTHKNNYKKFTDIIKNSGLKFKNNDGKALNKEELDLVKHPDTILKSNDLAIFILVYGMKNGSFTGKKLSDFINNKETDFYNARSIINHISSSPEKYEKYAQGYLRKITTDETKLT